MAESSRWWRGYAWWMQNSCYCRGYSLQMQIPGVVWLFFTVGRFLLLPWCLRPPITDFLLVHISRLFRLKLPIYYNCISRDQGSHSTLLTWLNVCIHAKPAGCEFCAVRQSKQNSRSCPAAKFFSFTVA